MEIAKYTIGTSIVFPQSEMARFDSQLRILESKMKTSGEKMKMFFNLNLSKFSVNQSAMNRVLGAALDIASTTTVFRIERFVVDQSRLNMALGGAMAKASAVATVRTSGSTSTATKAAATGGMIGGGLSRFYGPALALGLGGYGLGSLNKRNQEVVAAQLQTQAVSLANGGTAQQGEESFNWLRNQANRVGFNYLDASSDFNVLTSNLLGSGGTVAQSRNIFKGFAEYGRVNKLSPARQKLVFNALSQIAGKDKLQAEELTKQLGNSLPGAKDIFAQAYQQQTGGKLQGSAAIIALEAAMKKGTVRGNILDVAATIASQRAAPGLTKAAQASQAEQARYQNAVSDTAILASNSGVEEGFARIFRTLTAGLSESNGLVRSLAEGFNEATKWADDLLLFPQSFVRALEGKDSLVADWLGIDKSSQLVQDWKDIKVLWEQMSSLNPNKLFGDFLPTLQATTKELAAILNAIAEFQRWKSGNLPTENTNNSDTEKASLFGIEYTSPAALVGDFVNNTFAGFGRAKERGRAVYDDPNSFYYQNPALYDDNQKNMAMDQSLNQSQPLVAQQFDISINIDPVTLANMNVEAQAKDLGDWFRAELSNASVNFPVKE